MITNLKILAIFFLLISTVSCSKFNSTLKNPDWRVRYKIATEYYEKEDYYRAGILFEELIPILRGLPEAEKVQLNFAYCNFHQGQYSMSSHYFKTFFNTYRRSEAAEESLFMQAYSLYSDSPNSNLDQESTHTAIEAFQNFVNTFPKSSYALQSDTLIRELRFKLESKYYDIAKLYGKLDNYKSAVVSLENFQKDFPDSQYLEEIAFLKIQAGYNLARDSYYTKQKERYEKTIEYYQNFVEKYPKSAKIREAEKYFENALIQIRLLGKPAKREENASSSSM